MKTLTIKDLVECKELDRKAMAQVRGGFASMIGGVLAAFGHALATAARS